MKTKTYPNNQEEITPCPVGHNFARTLCARWQELGELYLPTTSDDDLLWRYSRPKISGDREQGWKLHISATVLNANKVLEKTAPFLTAREVLFKAPVSLLELGKLNAGIYYGYSQIGKFITVYPQTDEAAVELARKLHKLTYGIPAPLIPFDMRFRSNSCVYYRYGAFKYLEIENLNGAPIPAIRDLEGNLVPDEREVQNAKPAWVSDPFPVARMPKKSGAANPLKDKYKVFRALTQRGKGGVYNAVDISTQPPRLCVIKEGRKYGELDWEGCDGYWHVKREARVLNALQAAGLDVPQIYSSFELDDNFYLVVEHIEGKDFHKLLTRKRRRLSVKQALEFSIKLSSLIAEIHSAGWVWRDCKPANLIITNDGRLRPIDFEGACLINEQALTLSGTLEFLAPEWNEDFDSRSKTSLDVFALGTVIYYLFTGQFYSAEKPIPINKLRRNVPREIREIISKLLALNPPERPSALAAARKLKYVLNLMSGKIGADELI